MQTDPQGEAQYKLKFPVHYDLCLLYKQFTAASIFLVEAKGNAVLLMKHISLDIHFYYLLIKYLRSDSIEFIAALGTTVVFRTT